MSLAIRLDFGLKKNTIEIMIQFSCNQTYSLIN